MKFTRLADWLQWLEAHHPSEIDLGLARIVQVARRMNLLTSSAKVVTVAGTNGKGSCVAAVSALLQQAGWSVGVYTSPHLKSYNERIMLNGANASDEQIMDAFQAIYDACQSFSPAISLTYFEYGTLAALHVFSVNSLDAIVLEVGLGGRLDAVNIVDADVAVVTSIDIDHKDWLGDTRELIGVEKAGVYRAHKPAICADAQPPQSLIDFAVSIQADLQLVNHAFSYTIDEDRNLWSWRSDDCGFTDQPLPSLPLPSMAAALQVMVNLNVSIDARTFECLASLGVPGRFQLLTWRDRQLIFDVAHNPAATGLLAHKLELWRKHHSDARVYAVVAMMADKDRLESLRNLIDFVDYWTVAELPHIPRAASSQQLNSDLRALGLESLYSGEVTACLNNIHGLTQPQDLILIFGSFFTVAEGLSVVGYTQS